MARLLLVEDEVKLGATLEEGLNARSTPSILRATARRRSTSRGSPPTT